jgi:DNA polymerase III epsilon subunit-like protein
MIDYCVFDFETTGVEPTTALPIQVAVYAPSTMENPLSWFVNQVVDIPVEATAIHKITTKQIRDFGISPRESIEKLLGYFSNHEIIVGHNCIRYDRVILEKECERYGFIMPYRSKYRDTAAMFKALQLHSMIHNNETHFDFTNRILEQRVFGLKFNLKLCVEMLKIPIDRDFHDAAADVYYTAKIFERFCDPFGVME